MSPSSLTLPPPEPRKHRAKCASCVLLTLSPCYVTPFSLAISRSHSALRISALISILLQQCPREEGDKGSIEKPVRQQMVIIAERTASKIRSAVRSSIPTTLLLCRIGLYQFILTGRPKKMSLSERKAFRRDTRAQPRHAQRFCALLHILYRRDSHAASYKIFRAELCGTVLCRIHTHYIGYGERFTLLANDLGGLGVLYILPDGDSETLWTKELPKSPTRQARVSILQKLRESGICEEANGRSLHDLAESEVEGVSKPLKDAVQRDMSRSLSRTPFSAAREPSCTGTQSAEIMSSNAPNNFEQTAIINSLANRAEPTCTQSTPDALAQNAICALTHYEPSSIHIPDANIAAGSSATESHQSSYSLDESQATIDTASSEFHLNGALPPGNHPGLGQQAIQQRINVSPQTGFFHVLQAFQGATLPTGYTDATEAISTGFLDAPGQFWDAMQDTSRWINAQANQRTTWVENTQLSSDNTGIDGYHNVYQAVQPSSEALPDLTVIHFGAKAYRWNLWTG